MTEPKHGWCKTCLAGTYDCGGRGARIAVRLVDGGKVHFAWTGALTRHTYCGRVHDWTLTRG